MLRRMLWFFCALPALTSVGFSLRYWGDTGKGEAQKRILYSCVLIDTFLNCVFSYNLLDSFLSLHSICCFPLSPSHAEQFVTYLCEGFPCWFVLFCALCLHPLNLIISLVLLANQSFSSAEDSWSGKSLHSTQLNYENEQQLTYPAITLFCLMCSLLFLCLFLCLCSVLNIISLDLFTCPFFVLKFSFAIVSPWFFCCFFPDTL